MLDAANPPQRIVSLAPAITEMLFALGAGDRVVGVTAQCDYPPEAASRAIVGDFATISLERVIVLEPDLVLCTGGIQEQVGVRLKELGLRVEQIYPRSVDGMLEALSRLGALVGCQAEAAMITADCRMRLGRLSARIAALPTLDRPRVFVEIWDEPLVTAGADSFLQEVITLAGGRNIADSLTAAYPRIDPEFVVLQDPQVIMIGYTDTRDPEAIRSAVAARPGWGGVSGVRDNRVLVSFDVDLLLRPGIRLIEAIERLSHELHPAP